ncbi:MAG: hypothetical protein WBM44_23180 [Waterburya sp.]
MNAGERVTKWMRYCARALAIIWAGWWTFFGLASGFGEGSDLVGVLIHTAFPGLVFLSVAVLAWRSPAMGGIALLLVGVLTFILFPGTMDFPFPSRIFMLLTFHLPPLIAGFLSLASSWRT